MSLILCPKCSQRQWSQDYFVCSNCGYEESREWVLLEENKDFEESYSKGDNPALNLSFWMREQKKLCQKMVDYLLPNHNLKPVSFRKNKSWGCTIYRENDQNKAELAKERFKTKGGMVEHFNYFTGFTLTYRWGVKYLTTYDPRPSEINIAPQALITEWSDNTIYGAIKEIRGTGAGFLPTTAHESAHASHEVNWDENFLPWVNEGHDQVWRAVYLKFFGKLQQEYGKEVKGRFVEYRRMIGGEGRY